jgi:hypothetical protein
LIGVQLAVYSVCNAINCPSIARQLPVNCPSIARQLPINRPSNAYQTPAAGHVAQKIDPPLRQNPMQRDKTHFR